MNDRAGFTLTELLITVVIIALLASIAISTFGASRERSYDATALSDLRNVLVAVEAYYADNRAYPTSIDEVDFTPSPKVTFSRFRSQIVDGVAAVHIHVGHDLSSHFFHFIYPVESTFEKRDK